MIFTLFIAVSGCATRRYVRDQIAINNCVQVLKAIDRDMAVLDAAAEMDSKCSGPQRSEIRQRVYDKAVYEMSLRLNKHRETTQKINGNNCCERE